MRYTLHHHVADRAGSHDDLRLEQDDGSVRSWAIPKGFPQQMYETRLAIEGPLHGPDCLDFDGAITEGYGKGILELLETGEYEIYCQTPQGPYTIYTDRLGTFTLRPFKENWLIRRTK